jgi:hypothetical protein
VVIVTLRTLPVKEVLLATGYWRLATGDWRLATGYWLLATGYWLLATGYWLLATGYWLLLTFPTTVKDVAETAARHRKAK